MSSDDCSDGGAENKHCQIADVVKLHRYRALQNRTLNSNTKVLIKNHKGANCKKGNGGADGLKFFHGALSATHGSKADIAALNSYVRFTPESGHSPTRSGCLLWATSLRRIARFANLLQV